MKTRIYSKFCIALTLFMFMAISLFSQAPPVTTIGTATFSAGTFSVPITVTGFTNVGNISMKLNYDQSKLVYSGALVNSGLKPGGIVKTPVTNQSGAFALSYSSGTAIVLAAPTTNLLTLSFTLKAGIQGVRIPLTWGTGQGDCEITPPVPGTFVPPITGANLTTYFINGFINIPPVPVITGPGSVFARSTGNIYSTAPGMTGYIWTVLTGGAITSGSGTNSITVTWSTAGNQAVTVTYTDALAGPAAVPTSFPVAVTDITTGIEPIQDSGNRDDGSEGFRIFPNPAHDHFYLSSSDQSRVKLNLSIYSFDGVLLKKFEINDISTDGTYLIQVTDLTSGVYFLNINKGLKNGLVKLIIL